MKLLLLVFLFPLTLLGQLPGREDDSLRKVSDTMHFADPFQFSMSAVAAVKSKALLERCNRWMESVKDSLGGMVITKDNAGRVLTAVNVPATADISCTVVIKIKGNNYLCILKDYTFHTINGKSMPLEAAVSSREYATTAKIEKVIIARNHATIFTSLEHYVKSGK